MIHFLLSSRALGLQLVILILVLLILSFLLFGLIVNTYFKRGLNYLTLQDRLEVYESARQNIESTKQQLKTIQTTAEPQHNQAYLVISIAERTLWLKKEGKDLFKARIATGSDKTLVNIGHSNIWKFETPRGRLVVQDKEKAPVWVPPDWHYVEQARKRGLRMVYVQPRQSYQLSDSSVVQVIGNEVVRIHATGNREILHATAQKDIVLDGKLFVPPLGTSQRRYKDVLGPYSLELGDGYAIHGTNQPESIGQAVSHGCVRMLNEDITKLYQLVPVGTPVYIY